MDEKREVDIRFYEDWDKNEKFVQQCLNEEKEWLKTLESFAFRKFVDWDWKKTFNSIEEAMEFLLGHSIMVYHLTKLNLHFSLYQTMKILNPEYQYQLGTLNPIFAQF